jgi:hypothetical protein
VIIGHVPAPFETAVPDDAAQAEAWFHNFYQTSTRCDLGQNHLQHGLQVCALAGAWVRETTFGANAWIDVHVFAGGDTLIHSETLTLTYSGFGPVFRYEFSGKVYQGSTATPGSV